MTLDTIRLKVYDDGNTGTSPDNTYDITMIDSVDVNSSKDALSISPPGASSSNNLLLGVSGMQADITINWAIHDDGADKSNGTNATTVVTLEEQTTYLEDTMHAPDFSAAWELDHTTGDIFNDDEVFLENINTPLLSRENRRWLPASMRLRRGEALG